MNATRRWLGAHPLAQGFAPAVVLIAISVPASTQGDSGWQDPQLGGAALVVAACVPLVFRLRWPVAVTAATILLEIFALILDSRVPLVPGASLIAVYTMATRLPRRAVWAIGLAAALCVTTAIMLLRPGQALSGGNLASFDLVILAVAFGDSVRNRRAYVEAVVERAERAERTRDELARRRVLAERVRIARELHDLVAHHMTLVNAQVGVAHHLVRTDPEKAFTALTQVKENSNAALEELRSTVDLLRSDDTDSYEPAPGLDGLEDLADTFRSAGLLVVMTFTGERRRLPSPVELAAYRIIQEALTNSRKHAGTVKTEVTVDYGEDLLAVTVRDHGRAGGKGEGTGHGIIGMRERAGALGGTLGAGPGSDGFVVQAALPLTPAGGQ
jgi:signal transduction histidine kinase